MDPFELAARHVSTRKFRPDPISDADLAAILDCGLRSSSSGNLQSWSVIVSQDPAQKERLYRFHLNQPMILQAPVLLTFCADFHRTRRWLKLRGAKDGFDDLSGFLVAAFDAVISAQSICLAAESKGLGICYMGTTLWCAEALVQEFGLPAGVIPVTTVVMGYPAEFPSPRDRLPLSGIVHHGAYQAGSDDELLETFREREVKGWERYSSMLGAEKMRELEAAGIGNLAQYYTSEFKYPKDKLAAAAEEYLRALRQQEFWNF